MKTIYESLVSGLELHEQVMTVILIIGFIVYLIFHFYKLATDGDIVKHIAWILIFPVASVFATCIAMIVILGGLLLGAGCIIISPLLLIRFIKMKIEELILKKQLKSLP